MLTIEAKIKLPPHPLWLIPPFGIANIFCILYYALILSGDRDAQVALILSLPFSISFGVLNLIYSMVDCLPLLCCLSFLGVLRQHWLSPYQYQSA